MTTKTTAQIVDEMLTIIPDETQNSAEISISNPDLYADDGGYVTLPSDPAIWRAIAQALLAEADKHDAAQR